ncbi:hypothetical protein [Endozoicomonas arenosclerae]|uniref:hypothetical protein n=1 Tax=Endozoicomonas arenosclerae TaxID=1633495 RepID=UPI000780A3C5|nr:hypothetical protein [Endozoicomonas arenosclerae]
MKAILTSAGLSALLLYGGMSYSADPDAYMHALATGPANKQLVIRLPMHILKDSVFSEQNGKLRGKATTADKPNALGSAYDWEVIGQFDEVCPYHDPGKVGTDKKGTKDKKDEKRPKLQSLLVLKDGSLVYTCERSNIIIKHPNQGSLQTSYQMPEVNIALKSLLTDGFDRGSEKANPKEKENYNNEYGISLAYSPSHNLIYVGFEDQVYILDLEKMQPTSTQEDYFYPLQLDKQNLKVEVGVSIITLALSHFAGQPLYLFASSATKDEKFAPTPVKMIALSADGRSAERIEEAPFAKALQFASLNWEADGTPTGNGLKADITYLAAETLLDVNSTLVAHLHHNNIGVFHDPYTVSTNVQDWIKSQGEEKLSQLTFHPEKYNQLFEESSQDQLTPPILPLHSQIVRLYNFEEKPVNMKPNYYSLYDRVVQRVFEKQKDPKSWLNNDVMSVFNGYLYSIPWKDDVSLKIMAHPLRREKGWNNGNQPEVAWSEAAELPDMLIFQRSGKPVYVRNEDGTYTVNDRQYSKKGPFPQWWPGGSYWSAVYISPASQH